jgi:hypothetical protein
VARDADAKIGGMFLFEKSALNFANRHTWPVRCAIIYPSEKFELDIENDSNRLWLILGRKSMSCHIARSAWPRSLLGRFVGQMLTECVVALFGRLDQAARFVVLEDRSFRLWRRG